MNTTSMTIEDNKVKLYLELSMLDRKLQIINITDLSKGQWNPNEMFIQKDFLDIDFTKQLNYYIWITDSKVIDYAQALISNPSYAKLDFTFEFNANYVELTEPTGKDEYKAVLALVNVKDARCIYDITKMETKMEIFKQDGSYQLFYSLTGPILSIVSDLKDPPKKSINNNIQESNTQDNPNDLTDGREKDKDKRSKDGHWFLIMNPERARFLKLVRFKVISFTDSKYYNILDPNIETGFQKDIEKNIQNNKMLKKYVVPITKDFKLFHLYQNRNCIDHQKKNDFICKTCRKFCCLECFDNTFHVKHKIKLIEKVILKKNEDSKALDERIKNLLLIIEGEIDFQKGELDKLNTYNKETIKELNNKQTKSIQKIRDEELRRMKKLSALGTEIQRISNEFHQKKKYLDYLGEQGDMTSFCTNYFIFDTYIKTELKKNLNILSKKIKDYMKIIEPEWEQDLQTVVELNEKKSKGIIKTERKIEAAVFSKLEQEILNKENEESNVQIILLDFYKKNINEKEASYRMIAGVIDVQRKELKIIDGIMQIEVLNITIKSLENAKIKLQEISDVYESELKTHLKLNQSDEIKLSSFIFSKETKEQFVLVEIVTDRYSQPLPKRYLCKLENNTTPIVITEL